MTNVCLQEPSLQHLKKNLLILIIFNDTKGINKNTNHSLVIHDMDCRGAVASVQDSYTDDPSSILSDWLLHHGDNRGRHSANHNLLLDMHLRANTCRDSSVVQDVREGNW